MSEAYWKSVMHDGMSPPTDRSLDEATVELVEMLAVPNPRWRDDLAFPLLSTWIAQGIYDHHLCALGDGVAKGLTHGLGQDESFSVLRRSYSALLLTELVGRDNNERLLAPRTVISWGDLAMSWYVREVDHRAWIPEQGWAQAIVHGADLLGVLSRSRHFGHLELTVLLDVIADRLLKPTTHVWTHGENDHLAHAVMVILHRDLLDETIIETWLARLGAGVRQPPTRGHSDHDWPTADVHNTSGFLRSLHLQLALGARGRTDFKGDEELFASPPNCRADVLLDVLEQIRAESPWLYKRPHRERPIK